MKEKATIYDFKRFCKSMKNCNCPLYTYRNFFHTCFEEMLENPDGVNEIILNWCKEHPVETRQDKLLKMFPNARIDTDGALEVQPCQINKNVECEGEDVCNVCRNKYWLAEGEE